MGKPTSDADRKRNPNSDDQVDVLEEKFQPYQADQRYLVTKKEIYAYYWYDNYD